MAALLEQLPLLEGDGKALQHYAHAMATLAQGDPQTALSYFRKLSGVKRDRVEIAGVSLVVPEELRPQLQQLPHMTRRRWLQWAGWGATGAIGAVLLSRALTSNQEISQSEVLPEGLQQQNVLFPIEVVTVNLQGEEVERQQNQVNGVRWSQGDEFTLEMVDIPAGEFEMGAPEAEEGWNSFESPQHVVRVDAFSMGRYPITQAQWRFVAGLPRIDRNLEPDPSSFTGDNRPVERVSWYEAVEFCDRLSEFLGTPCRLPSEAEWEYACRARTTTPFHFGETITPELANYRGIETYGDGPSGIYREETTSVGSFGIANAFGLYDMHGNVWEWCQDVWHSNYDGAPTDGSAWVEGGDDSIRLLRGGSWALNPQGCRSANRGSLNPDDHGVDIGFRLVSGSARAL
jgi:formylglycine-generating enzyme required for sulfatase activity